MKRTPALPSRTRTFNQTTECSAELNDRIRCRAYELYEQRGREDGHDLEDWLRAESELTQKDAKAAAA
jgi:hypothetical protein